jgi:hypothetical protein
MFPGMQLSGRLTILKQSAGRAAGRAFRSVAEKTIFSVDGEVRDLGAWKQIFFRPPSTSFLERPLFDMARTL